MIQFKRLFKTIEKPALEVAEKIDTNKKIESIARMGFVVNGLLHGVIGVAAVAVGLAGGQGEIDQSGVLRPLGASIFGSFLLILMSAALIALGLWKVVQIILTKKARIVRTTLYQIEEGFKAVVYVVIGISLLVVVASHGNTGNSVESSQDFAAMVLASPIGPVIFVLVSLLVIGVGCNFIYRAVTKRYLRSLELKTDSITIVMTVTGMIGYISKGLIFIALGFVGIVVAVTSDASKESGIDGAFKLFVRLPFGTYLLALIGGGFLSYAIYSLIRSKYGHFRVKRHKYL